MRALLVSLLLSLGVSAPGGTPPGQVATAVTPASPRAAQVHRLRPHGRWLLDARGRVRILTGVNMVAKRPPYAPDALGFGADDARFLARHGFTSVRLGVPWEAVEPQPGTYDDAYLRRLHRTIRILGRQGIWTLLDFHQDLYNERFQGEGEPDWAVQDDGLPAEPQQGFPDNYLVMPALERAFDHFWANDPGPGGIGLQRRYADAWAHVAAYFSGTPRVLGFDLFNEPWPGTPWPTCINPDGCPAFDATLQAFTGRMIRAIRTVDRRTPIFYEPNVLFNSGAATHVVPHGRRLAFSFHDYCLTASPSGHTLPPGCAQFDDRVWTHVAQHVRASGDAALLTEFGATRNTAVLRDMLRRAAAARTGWQYWAYCGCHDPTTSGPGATQALVHDPLRPPRGSNVERRKLRALEVPGPRIVAGTPLRYRYRSGTHVFRMSWSTARPSGHGRFHRGSRTKVFVPRLAYPHGYAASVTGGRVVSHRGARVLIVALDRGARHVHLVVRPLTQCGTCPARPRHRS
jgi:endoglycosylceramidase